MSLEWYDAENYCPIAPGAVLCSLLRKASLFSAASGGDLDGAPPHRRGFVYLQQWEEMGISGGLQWMDLHQLGSVAAQVAQIPDNGDYDYRFDAFTAENPTKMLPRNGEVALFPLDRPLQFDEDGNPDRWQPAGLFGGGKGEHDGWWKDENWENWSDVGLLADRREGDIRDATAWTLCGMFVIECAAVLRNAYCLDNRGRHAKAGSL